jgi:putative NIF3 family GTP cyclohydrolase 1 type 2
VVRISTALTATDDVIVWGIEGGVAVVVVGRGIWFNQIFYLTLLSMPNLRNRLTHEC